jgi:hypothetical protein
VTLSLKSGVERANAIRPFAPGTFAMDGAASWSPSAAARTAIENVEAFMSTP